MCRACGASDESGWNDDSAEGDWEPDDEFDYDSFVAREFPDQVQGTHLSHRNEWVKFVLVLVVISLLLSLALF